MQAEAGGHGYSTAREIKGLSDLLDKTGSVKLVAAEAAQNSLTQSQEFNWGDIFMRFNYQNKGGKLFANGRPIEDINSINEIGGERMSRVTNALDRMMQDSSIAESIVVSEDLGYGRHFIYRYRRGENSDIEGLAFEYQGKAEELGRVVNELGHKSIDSSRSYKNSSIDFSVPLFFTNENKHSEIDLARAASNSFNSEERRRDMKKYLDRLNRDTTQFEELTARRSSQEQELAKQYEKIILSDDNAKTGIANAVFGTLQLVEKMVEREDRKREESKPIDLRMSEDIQDKRIPLRDSKEMLPLLVHGIVAIPGLIDHTGRLLDKDRTPNKSQVNDQDTDSRDVDPDILHEKDLTARKIVGPLAPGLIGLSMVLSVITENSFKKDDESRSNYLLAVEMSNGENEEANSSHFDELLWQEFIAAIFTTNDAVEYKNEMSLAKQIGPESAEKTNGFLAKEEGFKDALVGFIPIIAENKVNEHLLVGDKEEQEMFITDLQKGLEVLAELVVAHDSIEIVFNPEEKAKQKILENDVVTLGKELFGILIRDAKILEDNKDKKTKPQIDTLASLTLLLRAYEDPNSGDLVKSVIAALIYKQIQQIKENKLDFGQNPEIIEIFEKFDELSPFVPFLDERINLILSVLHKYFPVIFSGNRKKEVDNDPIGKIIYIIFQLTQPQISFEKLPSMASLNKQNIFPPPNSKKKKQRTVKQGVIFCFDKRVIFEYSVSDLLTNQNANMRYLSPSAHV